MTGDPQGPRRTPPRTAQPGAASGDPRARRPDPTGGTICQPDASEADGAGRRRKGMGVEPT